MAMNQRKKMIIGGTVILAAILAMTLLSVKEFSVYFYTPEEAIHDAKKLSGHKIRVGGMVLAGSKVWNAEDLSLGFTLTNFQDANIKVSYKGTPPDMFKENAGVVVEGFIDAEGASMVAKELIVKHSEEYRIPNDPHSVNADLLKKSILEQ